MIRSVLALIICLASVAPALADGKAGYAGAFLRNGIGSRPMGMGGAYTAVAEGPDAIYYNPAGLGSTVKIDFTSSYKTLSLDRRFGYVAVSFPIRNEATMAASWVYAGVSDVIGRGNSRQTFGEISNNRNAFALSFAKVLHPVIAVGANLRYVQESLDNLETFTIGFDVGAMLRPRDIVSLGFAVQNIGSNYRWESSSYWSQGSTYDERFPVILKFGAAGYLLSHHLVPAIDLETSDKAGVNFRAGAEYWFTKTVTRQVPDEYEEDVFVDVEEEFRIAGLRAGLDRGAPTFGLSLFHEFGKIGFGFEYAFMLGLYGTSAGHLFTMNLGF